MKYTNIHGIPTPVAVWLAVDGYDFRPGARRAISVTSLMRPVRQILLSEQLDETTRETPDIADFIASRMGHAIHDSMEKAWTDHYREALEILGYPQHVIDRVRINPDPTTLEEGDIPVYLERRAYRTFRGYDITGKFDMIFDGQVNDTKSTSAYVWTSGRKDEDYQIQMSLYRWLNPELVTADTGMINFVFTDWQKGDALRNPNYPQRKTDSREYQLLSLAKTEAWLNAKIDALEAAAGLPQDKLPLCSDKELWRSDPAWKYYADPAKANLPGARSTRTFDNPIDANAMLTEKGKGIVKTVPGQVKACPYCPAFPICTQRQAYSFD